LEEQLKEIQVENEKLKIGKEKAEALTQQEKQRADQLEFKLKKVGQFLYQLKKINYYQQLEQQTQIIQSPKPSPNFK